MPLQQTSGNVTADAYGGGAAAVPNYIEDVFSTYLYDGNATARNIQNGIDLAVKGGMVWIKTRTQGASGWDHVLYDTARGANKFINSNLTVAQNSSFTNMLTGFNSDGFSLGNDANTYLVNQTGYGGYVSWTFRKQPKFFDVVTFSGNSASGRQIAHSLGSAPGCIIVKNLTTANKWVVWHKDLGDFAGSGKNLVLNTTAAVDTGGYFGTAATQTSTYFTVKANNSVINWTGNDYVAYLFAHDAGGFGLTGTDNVISCGSYTGNGSATGPIITLGYEPQWVLIKNVTDAGYNWNIMDNMRGTPVGGATSILAANTSDAEGALATINPLATGFQLTNAFTFANKSGSNYIYIAIRRGPMKVPTDGTKVFVPVSQTASGQTNITSNFPVDLAIVKQRDASNTGQNFVFDRLRGGNTGDSYFLYTNSTSATVNISSNGMGFDNNTALVDNFTNSYLGNITASIYWMMRRAPGFFDEVCYSGNGVNSNITHNLGVAPELIIVKARSGTINQNWNVCFANTGANNLVLNDSREAFVDSTRFPTSGGVFFPTYFKVGTANGTNNTGYTYVAYLFASCPGVSKVGSYTGNGSTQTINCGFTGGARFVLIKRTDLDSGTGTAGDWYVYDTARGMTTLTDPYLLLDSTAAESATLGSVTSVTTGFAVNASILAAINTNGASYIYLSIA